MRTFLAVTAFAFLSSSCIKVAKTEKDRAIRPYSEILLDLSALDAQPNLFGGKNPVGVLRMNLVANRGMMAVCTAFIISAQRVLTNHHCIHDKDANRLAQADELALFLKNPGDGHEKTVRIDNIIDFEDVDDPNVYKSRDWALLKPSEDLSQFSKLDSIYTLPSLAEVKAGMKFTVARFNPPSNNPGDKTATLAPVSASLEASSYFTASAKSAALILMKDDCRKRQQRGTDELKVCENLTITDEEIYAELQAADSLYLDATEIRHGNSGSPVLLDGNVIGLIHSGVFSPANKEAAPRGIMQVMHQTKERMSK